MLSSSLRRVTLLTLAAVGLATSLLLSDAAAAQATQPASVPAKPVVLQQVLSREHPKFAIASARLGVGRDGNVYLASSDYVIRVTPEGGKKAGSLVTYATQAVTANPAGVVATANGHFAHCVSFYRTDFTDAGKVSDFLNDDKVQYFGPGSVQAGPSGDFYGLDQNRNRILRVAPPDKVITSYSLAPTGEDYAGHLTDLRVSEAAKRFYIITDKGTIHCMGFDGKLHYSVQSGVSLNMWDGHHGPADVDDEGKLYFVRSGSAGPLEIIGTDGKPAGKVELELPAGAMITDLRLLGKQVLVRTRGEIDLFTTLDLATGKKLRTARGDVEVLTATLPGGDVWTAGQPTPVQIQLDAGERKVSPNWQVRLARVNVPEWTVLPLVDGKVTPPADAAGLYRLQVGQGEYLVQALVEIRQPGAKGSATVTTRDGQLYYGWGEAVPVTVHLRAQPADVPDKITLTLRDAQNAAVLQRELTVEKRKLPAENVSTELSREMVRTLAPGKYWLTVAVPGLTCVPQRLVIGSGLESRPIFHVVQHGDYSLSFDSNVTPWTAPELVAEVLSRGQKLGTNLYVDRVGHAGAGGIGVLAWNNANGQPIRDAWAKRLADDPLSLSPAAVGFQPPYLQAMAAWGAHGIEQQSILLYMDAGLPIGTGFDARKPEQFESDVTKVSQTLLPYPAFRGWSWAANWWIGTRFGAAAPTPEVKKQFEDALAKANKDGTWDPVLDQVSDIWINYAVDAEKQLRGYLNKAAPGKLSVMTGPYRQPGMLPPLTFRNADEVDMHYQAEQIQPPQVTPHEVDFYKRPGKPAWGHPEVWNDDGTGGMLYPTLLQMFARGADGVGWSGAVPSFGSGPADDVRATGMGKLTTHRATSQLWHQYGPWHAGLAPADPIAIVVSTRPMRIEDWKGIGGWYFTRLYEAYNACLYAHRPASFVFAEDLKPDTLNKFQAVLVVSQTVEMEKPLADALAAAAKAGVKIYYDDTCRKELVKDFRPLGLAFNKVEDDPSVWQDDSAYVRIPAHFIKHAAALEKLFAQDVTPVAATANPELMLTERRSGEGRFVWVINNTLLPLEPGLAWRTSLIMSQRLPIVERVTLNDVAGKAVYDVTALKRVQPQDGTIETDLRTAPARLYAVLPRPIGSVSIHLENVKEEPGSEFGFRLAVLDDQGQPVPAEVPVRLRLLDAKGQVLRELFTSAPGKRGAPATLTTLRNGTWPLYIEASELISGKSAAALALPARRKEAPAPKSAAPEPIDSRFGLHFRQIALSADGNTAAINAMNWDQNLLGINLEDGGVRWQQRVGHHFAYGPQTAGTGLAVQGFDLTTAEGYHLYLLNAAGERVRRFALYGLPKRVPSWCTGHLMSEPINSFAFAPDGSYIAASGDLGQAVWSADGKLLWSDDWWKQDQRRRQRLLAVDAQTLLTLEGMHVTARKPDGQVHWQHELARTGMLQGGVATPDGKTIALRATTEGGRIFVLRDGKPHNTLYTPAEALAITSDGRGLAITNERVLGWYDTDAGLVWQFQADDRLHSLTLSPDGQRLAACSELGTLYVFDRTGKPLLERDLRAFAALAWLKDGDLLAATWDGRVMRLAGANFTARWDRRIEPQPRELRKELLAADPTPTTRIDGWGNAAAKPAALTPNLMTATKVLFGVWSDPPGHGDPRELQNKDVLLFDGKPDAPPQPWLDWMHINYIDSGWRPGLAVQFDTFRTQLRLKGITFVEDPAHPESWLRDVRLQWWDAAAEQWRNGPLLLSNVATHTHMFDKPLEAGRFRLVSTGGGSWPVGNLRLGEVVLHGEVLGASHPDAAAGKPAIALFDEREADLRSLFYPGRPFAFGYEGAYSGGKCLMLKEAGSTGPAYTKEFGHSVPSWDFEIAEKPGPGQYRWLQLAWKPKSDKTTGMSVLLGDAAGYAITVGTHKWPEGVLATHNAPGALQKDWQVVRVDLWELYKKPVRIRAIRLAAAGDGAMFDQIILARTAEDLPKPK